MCIINLLLTYNKNYYELGMSKSSTHTIKVSAPFNYSNDENGLTVIIDGVTVYSQYGHWTARSWSGTIK